MKKQIKGAADVALRPTAPARATGAIGANHQLQTIDSLPADERAALAAKSAAPTATVSPDRAGASLSSSRLGALAEWQLEAATARAAILLEADKLCQALGVQQGFEVFVQLAREGSLAAAVHELLRVANARRGQTRALSVATLYEWKKLARDATTPAERITRLAPGKRRPEELADDVAAVLARYRHPNKPSLASCVAHVAGERAGPSFDALYSRVRRQKARVPAPILNIGRHTGAALKALRAFRRRDTSSLEPNDVVLIDGYSAKLRIAHPETGNPFVATIMLAVDACTREASGRSIALSETSIAGLDALRDLIARHGVPLVLYSDRGAGLTSKMLDAKATGILATLGIHHEVGIPGNPQGRGLIERIWRTIMTPLEKRFATYHGRDADRDTLRTVSLDIERQLRVARRHAEGVVQLPPRLPSFAEFVEALDAEIRAYNESHRHRSLPKFDGRHATPAQYRAYRLALSKRPQLDIPQPDELNAMLMPSVERVALRGEVRFLNGIYFHRDLQYVEGERVRVCYDIGDASHVIVRRLSGELVARAELSGNRSDYMPQPLLERLREQREARRLALLEKKADDIRAERRATALPSSNEASPEERAELERYAVEVLKPAPVNPLHLTDPERDTHWKELDTRRRGGEQLTDDEQQFWDTWQRSTWFVMMRAADDQFYRDMAARDAALASKQKPEGEPT